MAKGQDFWSGSHFDVYEAVWTSYKPGRPDPSTFDVPKECVSKIGIPSKGPLANAHLTITALLPTVGLAHATSSEADADFEAHNAAYGRQHGSEQEYQFRRGVYHRNAAYVAEWNAENERQAEEARRANKKYVPRHTLGLNRMADWTDEEYSKLALGHLRRENGQVEGEAPAASNHPDYRLPYIPEAELEDLPDSLDYTLLPQYSPVKDQASCGSCWAFGTTVTLQAAWYKATGETLSFSEQQMMDCSWKFSNYGCNGGLQDRAISYIVQKGGIAAEEDYQYLG